MVRLCVFLLATLLGSYVQAQATATLDRTTIQDNETVTLTLSIAESSVFSNPDLSALENDFHISQPQKSSQSQWINGRSSASTQWRYTLTPKNSGIITIPAISIGKQTSQPLSLHVREAKNPAGQITDPVFLEVLTDKTRALVQEQILLTIRINHAIQISNLELGQLDIDNARVIENSSTRFERHINGQTYTTHEIVYAIFPQQSGELTVPAISVNATIPRTQMDVMMRQGQTRRLRSETQTLEILAATSKQRLPAGKLQLQESWSADPQQLRTGDSISRTISIKASGLLAEQLPEISLSEQSGIRIYNEKPVFDNQMTAQGNTGTRTDSMAIVATQPGTVTLPAIRIDWWNTETGTQESAELPAITLTITGNSLTENPENTETISQPAPLVQDASEPPVTGVAANTSVLPWQLATLISSIIALTLAVLMLRQRRDNNVLAEPGISDTTLALRALQQACQNNDVVQIRQSLLVWARLAKPGQRIYALADIKRLFNDDAVNQWLNKLDASLYQASHNTENWQDFYRLLQEKSRITQAGNRLYPTR